MPMDWEERYRAGDTPWDKGAAHPALADFLGEEKLAGAILVPGCGLGYDVRALARVDNEVLGLDVAPSALAGALGFPKVAGESYELGDLFELPARLRGKFDAVFEHTCFCAIDPARRGDYAVAVAGALRSGGKLLAIFYLDSGREPGPPHGVTRAELDRWFDGRFALVREWAPARTYEGREGRELVRIYQKRD